MNILATSDLHGNNRAYEQIAYYGKNNDIDILIIAGDLTSYTKNNQEDEIKSILKTVEKPILFIMGNDDEYEWSSENNIININQIEYKFHSISFVGYQFTNPFVGGPFEKNEDDQIYDLKKLSDIVTDNTILITHGPCYGILDQVDSLNVGSKALSDFCKVKSPRFHLFGHIHENFGCIDNHYNLSFPKSKSVILINTTENYSNIIKI